MAPLTGDSDEWKHLADMDDIVAQGTEQWLMIEGEDIANVVFETYRPVFSKQGEAELEHALELGD